jgi:hypothetical protein
LAVAVSLVAAASATASVRHFSGSVAVGGRGDGIPSSPPPAGTISFKAVFKHGQVVRVLDVAWKHVPVVCSGSNGAGYWSTTSGEFKSANVVHGRVARLEPYNARRFDPAYTDTMDGAGWQVRGRFNLNFTKAGGTFDWGNSNSEVGHCQTWYYETPQGPDSELPWVARR